MDRIKNAAIGGEIRDIWYQARAKKVRGLRCSSGAGFNEARQSWRAIGRFKTSFGPSSRAALIAVGWLASLSDFLQPWAPLSYGIAALFTFLCVILGGTGSMALYGSYRAQLVKSKRPEPTEVISEEEKQVETIEDTPFYKHVSVDRS